MNPILLYGTSAQLVLREITLVDRSRITLVDFSAIVHAGAGRKNGWVLPQGVGGGPRGGSPGDPPGGRGGPPGGDPGGAGGWGGIGVSRRRGVKITPKNAFLSMAPRGGVRQTLILRYGNGVLRVRSSETNVMVE